MQSIYNDWIGEITGNLALKNSSCKPDSVDIIFFQHWKVVTISAFPSFSLLAVLLLHYLRLYLDLITPSLYSSMMANRADRQIYLHWWRKGRKEEEVISRGPSNQPRRLWQAEQTVWLLPIQGISLSLCSPWASEFSARWDQSLTRLTQSHVSLSGIGSRRLSCSQHSHRLLIDSTKPVIYFPYITFPLEHLMKQAATFHLHPELTRRVKVHTANRMTSFCTS